MKSRRVIMVACGLLLLQIQSASLNAQLTDAKSQPDHLTLGTVRVGATVEASVRVLIPGDDFTGIESQISPPKFVRVTQTRIGTQQLGNLGNFIYCDVFVSLNTERTSEFNDRLKVRLGGTEVEIPMTATVLEKTPNARRVLIVETPIQRFSTDDATLFEPWLNLVKTAELDVHYLEVDRGRPVLRELDLSNFDVVLLGGGGIFWARDEDFAKLNLFVESGGRAIVAANRFFMGTVAQANKFIVPHGLKLIDVEPEGQIPLIAIDEDQIHQHTLTAEINELKFYRPSPVTVEDPSKGTLLVKSPFDAERGYVAVARVGKGEVVALGISLWWNWIASQQESGADNHQLLYNLIDR